MQDQFFLKINVGLPDANSMYYWILHLKGQKNIHEFTEVIWLQQDISAIHTLFYGKKTR